MPELPEVEGLRSFLEQRLVGCVVTRTELAAFSALKTVGVPLTSLQGLDVERVERRGKFIALGVEGAWLAFHLARAGWLRWYDTLPASVARPTKGPVALRVGFETPDGDQVGFDLTEAGTQKKLAVHVVATLAEVPQIASLGVDPLDEILTREAFAELLNAHARTQIKGVLRDQTVLSGIGNAYSDEILHAAGLSPFKTAGSLDADEVGRLYEALRTELLEATARTIGRKPSELKDGKRSSLRVHGRKGQLCPTCGSTVGEVSFADSFLNYCPGCQTGGKPLADRRLSRLLK